MTFDMEVVKVMFTPFIADTEYPCQVRSFISKGKGFYTNYFIEDYLLGNVNRF